MTERERLYRRLGTRNIQGTETELILLAKRVDELARLNGEEWILENRESLLKQWDWTRCYLNSASN